jgi:hypothetical protein
MSLTVNDTVRVGLSSDVGKSTSLIGFSNDKRPTLTVSTMNDARGFVIAIFQTNAEIIFL